MRINSSLLFCEFSRGNFVWYSCDARTSLARIFMCREEVAKVLNIFKTFQRFFSPKIFATPSNDCRLEILAKLQCDNNFVTLVNVVRQLRDDLEKTCEQLATIWRGNKTKRNSNERRETLSRMSRDCHRYE